MPCQRQARRFMARSKQNDAELSWELGSGYIGCRTKNNQFHPGYVANVAPGHADSLTELR